MKDIQVRLGDRSYSIRIEPGLLEATGELVRGLAPVRSVAVISDYTVSGLFGKTVMQSFKAVDIEASLFTVPDGETSKSLGHAEKLYMELIRWGIRRDSLVVALGGGVIGDLAGFVAATVLRGVPLLQIPTTLLAQVDSSVGGKVGINHPLGKNLIGSFHQPRLVLIDPLVLDTLPMSERWSGASEVVKYALIRDPFFYNLLEKGLEQLIALENMEAVAGMIATCCQIKAEIVERDEKEGGLRRILNFGHTLAHALEAAAGYETFRHGEAVCYGMAWAIQVSKERGLLREEKFRRMDALLKRFPLPPIPETTTAEDLFIRIGLDKKQTAEGLYLVLLEDIGKAKIIPTPGVDLRQSIESILNRQIINL